MHRRGSRERQERLTKLAERAIKKGANVAYESSIPEKLAASGFYHPFTILTNVGKDNPLYSEEAGGPVGVVTPVEDVREAIDTINSKIGIVACIDSRDKSATESFMERVLRTRIDDGRHGAGCFRGTELDGDRSAPNGNPALVEGMVSGYTVWQTVYRSYDELE